MQTETDRVQRRIAEEVAACADFSGWEGAAPRDLAAHLVSPPRQEPFTSELGAARDRSMLWLAVDECPGKDEGYLVVYDASRDEFGLAVKARGGEDGSLVGWYGSLREALEGM